ncbi:hypothetical protein BT96DRAFT_995222 [Gymnopus androsaceus JB14]|uniref:Uncharacterized protein n=1 Tax=Gymnopus androsaceus JB14 TaxID=1447944 RepID=A0A6A4HHL9_9AGAR|nr:hypothetical protein BT96DRAFT_995222 [Gymnopus androsaceus JB14]
MDIRYIDDQYGDLVTGEVPVYSPQGSWTQGAECTGCGFHPASDQAFNNTWHDTTTHHTYDFPRTVQFNFTGTSLDVYCIIPNSPNPTLTSTYNLTFILDDQLLSQTFTHESDLSNNSWYNVSVLSLNNLTPVSHTFAMMAASTMVNSTLKFDYARYLSPSSHSTSSSTHVSLLSTSTSSNRISVAVIVGTTIGGIFFLCLLVILVFCYHRYKHRIKQLFFVASLRIRTDESESTARIDPFIYSSPLHRPIRPSNPGPAHPSTTAPSSITSSAQQMGARTVSAPPSSRR